MPDVVHGCSTRISTPPLQYGDGGGGGGRHRRTVLGMTLQSKRVLLHENSFFLCKTESSTVLIHETENTKGLTHERKTIETIFFIGT